MKCPVDGATLVLSDRQGIEIDYCPECRGVWLDRGEIDKIVERSGQGAPAQRGSYRHDDDDDDDRRRYDDRDHHQGHGKKHHRESWFGELFD